MYIPGTYLRFKLSVEEANCAGKLGNGDANFWRAHYWACAGGIGHNWDSFTLGLTTITAIG